MCNHNLKLLLSRRDLSNSSSHPVVLELPDSPSRSRDIEFLVKHRDACEYLSLRRFWHRNNFLDFVNWDPFEDDPLEMAFFHNQDPYFPRIHRTIGASHRPVSYPLVKRNDEDVFKLVLDVNGFNPNELSLKLAGRELLIKGAHSCNRKTQISCFQRTFCWRRTLPDDVDLKSIRAKLSQPTILEIEAKKLKENERDVRIDRLDSLGDQSLRNSKTNSPFDETRSIQRRDNNVKTFQEMDEATVEVVPDDDVESDSQ